MKITNNKELIIIAHYIYVGASSPQKVREILKSVNELISIGDKEDPKYRFKHYIHPVKSESLARIECIFPIMTKEIEKLLIELNEKYKDLKKINK